MKRMILALLLFVSTAASAFECVPNPYSSKAISVCHETYQSFFDPAAKIPVMVRFEIAPQTTLSCNVRRGSFNPDPLVKSQYQATDADYSGSGFDIGHMYPAEDALYSPAALKSTFYYTNAVPQPVSFNRGKWKSLEMMTRNWAIVRNTTMLVYTGPIMSSVYSNVRGVALPSDFYKVVVDTKTNEAIVFVMNNRERGSVTARNIVTSLPGVHLNLNQWTLRKTLWPKPKYSRKKC